MGYKPFCSEAAALPTGVPRHRPLVNEVAAVNVAPSNTSPLYFWILTPPQCLTQPLSFTLGQSEAPRAVCVVHTAAQEFLPAASINPHRLKPPHLSIPHTSSSTAARASNRLPALLSYSCWFFISNPPYSQWCTLDISNITSL